MAIAVKIDFSNTYAPDDVSKDFRLVMFRTILQTGALLPLKVEISNTSHELLPNVYNLAFGPLNTKGQIDDRAEIAHKDYSKVFSTILFSALSYLQKNNSHYLGVDGSDNYRAYYYWRFLQRNLGYLDRYFEIFGLKYYVRITRFGKLQYENPFNFDDIQPQPERIVKTDEWPRYMFNYFIFKLKKG